MRIVRNTPTQLIVEELPWLIAIATLLFTLIFLGVTISLLMQGVWAGFGFLIGAGLGYGAMAVFVERLQVIFHGPENYVEIRRRRLHSSFNVRHSLDEIEDAFTQTTRGDEEDMHRPALRIPHGQSRGTHPLTEIYASGGSSDRVVKAINKWLHEWRAGDLHKA